MMTDKQLKLIFLFFFFLQNINAQNILSAGGNLMQFESDDVSLRVESSNGFYLSYDFVAEEFLGFGIEFHSAFGEDDFSFNEIRLKLGAIIGGNLLGGKNSRIQIPIYPYLSFYNYEDQLNDQYGSLGFGGKAGIRFYIANRIALEGYYNYSRYSIKKVGDIEYDEAIGHITSNFISVGISYFISNSKAKE